jgi:hypothetical protein
VTRRAHTVLCYFWCRSVKLKCKTCLCRSVACAYVRCMGANYRAQELYGDAAKVSKLMQIDEALVLRRRELQALLTVLDQATALLGTVAKPTALLRE